MSFEDVVIVAFSHLFFGFIIYVDCHIIKFAKKQYEEGNYTITLAWLLLVAFLSHGYIASFFLMVRAIG